MSGKWIVRGRIVAMGIALAAAMLLFAAREAGAGFYPVAQCGWNAAGLDADWWDSTGGAKFRPDAYCGEPGAHAKSLTRDGQGTVSGTRFARWRWNAPPTTNIRHVRGVWWQVLHDGLEQRLGAIDAGGTFSPFLLASTTNVFGREFAFTFTPSVPAIEDRLLCARGDSKWCSLDPGSWSSLRSLTLTIDDGVPPGAWITGGDLTDGGWRRGNQFVSVDGYDAGSGVRFGETTLDGARVGLSEYPCEQALIEGEWRATRMRPCLTNVSAVHWVATTGFSDGAHTLGHCTSDFAGNAACAPSRTVLIDNNPPAHPHSVALVGGEGWRRVNDFDLAWLNPDQGAGSPIGGATWRLLGPAYDTGVRFAPGRWRTAMQDLSVPAAGAYSLQLWLRDEAGNEAPASAVTVPLRLDDLRPTVAFASDEGPGLPEQLRATVEDGHSGPAAGSILYRRADSERWLELPTRLVSGGAPSRAQLVTAMPELAPGTYLFRADAVDAAGNAASTTLRADGTQMALRKVAPAVVPRASTRLFARLRGSRGRGDRLTAPFAAGAVLSGRLTKADGIGIPEREVRLVSRFSRGSSEPATSVGALTGTDGSFRFELPPGPSRRLDVYFAGDARLEPAGHSAFELRVRSGIVLRAAPRKLRTGQVLRLSGQVRRLGTPMPRRGKVVAIQYLEEATRRWRPVLVTRSGHRGRFRARYRLRYVTGRARIVLRAVALAEERWPYAPGASRSVVVHVRGSRTR
ncbi:MAG TPA: hypothetical protein VK889_08640 [Solirubrobacterales bacterium]|nr:hypothetical protein [Solirubrobacterales bacterium]